MKSRIILLLVFIAGAFATKGQIITTIAGGGTSGLGDGGPAIDCELELPRETALDAKGNLYITDETHNLIRKINTSGIITTIAGNGTGGYNGDNIAATSAELNLPYGIAVDNVDNVYISDNGNYRIRKVDTNGIITTVAGTGAYGYNGDNIAATAATLYSPHGILIDGHGDLLICDDLNERIRKVSPATGGIITTIAGNGTQSYSGDGGAATSAEIGWPYGIAADATGNVYIAELWDNRVRKIDPEGIINTIAGIGGAGYNGDNIPATTAELKAPVGIAVDYENNVYIGELHGNRVRKVNASGIITTIAGTGTAGFNGDNIAATAAELYYPEGVTVDGAGNLYITDGGNSRIRYIKGTLAANSIKAYNEEVSVYPNPSTTGRFTVNVNSGYENNIQIFISDIMGQEIKRFFVDVNKGAEINIDIPNGVYFLSAITTSGIVTKKLVVNR